MKKRLFKVKVIAITALLLIFVSTSFAHFGVILPSDKTNAIFLATIAIPFLSLWITFLTKNILLITRHRKGHGLER